MNTPDQGRILRARIFETRIACHDKFDFDQRNLVEEDQTGVSHTSTLRGGTMGASSPILIHADAI